jgi:2,4-dienoyl-CoA reductase-like NADH-dependent reductase (Old Yellow Enzyme family)
MKTPDIFGPMNINRMELMNRFVRSATFDIPANRGMVTDALLNLYRRLAEGNIGLIITGGLFTNKNGQLSSLQLGAHRDETVPGLKKLVKVVHEKGGKIAAQLLHGGLWSSPEVTGSQPVGPSSTINPLTQNRVRSISTEEIQAIIDHFTQASRRVIEAGFDAVQLHGAHSYLISQFLSPAVNKRTDEWGGSPERRCNFVCEIYRQMRDLTGPDYPIFIKLGITDQHPEGKLLDEGIATAKMLEAQGIDAIEVSGGFEADMNSHIRSNATSPYYLWECRQARRALTLPLILVGGMRKLQEIRSVIKDGIADAVSMCRPFINDPYIIQKFREGLTEKSKCISCNYCISTEGGKPYLCFQHEKG